MRADRHVPSFNYVQTFSIYKASEGGPVKQDVMQALKAEGIKAESCASPFLGQTGITVATNSKRLMQKAERIILG